MVALAENTNISELQKTIMNWKDLPDKVKNHLLMGVEFTVTHNGEDLYVYTNSALHAHCSIVDTKKGKVRIVDCWVSGGKNIW